jgi:hypothetical protein
MVVTPEQALLDVGYTWKTWGGVWGEADPIHFEYPGFVPPGSSAPPEVGGNFYKLADFISGFVPGLGMLQLVDSLVSALDGNNDKAGWYLQHPAEALRDLYTWL